MTIRTYLFGILIVLLFVSFPAESADWLNYVESESGDKVFIDMESIRSTPSNTISIIKKTEPLKSTAIASVLHEIEIDCNNGMIRYLKETIYFKGGRSRSSSKNEEFRKITVKDDDESLMELVCSLKRSQ